MEDSRLLAPPLGYLEIRGAIHFLCLKNKTAKETFCELKERYGDSAPPYRTVARWVAHFKGGRKTIENLPRPGRPKDPRIRTSVRALIEEDKSRSLSILSALSGHSRHTIKEIVVEELHYTKSSVKYVAHILSPEQKQIRFDYARQLLAFLKAQPENAWRYIWTQDETWIYLSSPFEFLWTTEDEERQLFEKETVATSKCMISVMMNFDSSHCISLLPKKTSYTKKFFEDTVLKEWEEEELCRAPLLGVKGCSLHMDNSRCHNVDELLAAKKVNRLLHPP